MKKILGLATLTLAGVLAFSGCNSNENNDGQEQTWTEETGTYVFDYAKNGETTFTCANNEYAICENLKELSVEVAKDGKITISNYKDGNGEITLVYYPTKNGEIYNLSTSKDGEVTEATAQFDDNSKLTLNNALYGAGSVITFRKTDHLGTYVFDYAKNGETTFTCANNEYAACENLKELSVEVTKEGKITISNYKDANGEITLVYYYYSIDGNTYNLAIKRDNQIESVNATAVYKDGRLTLTGALYGGGSVITFRKADHLGTYVFDYAKNGETTFTCANNEYAVCENLKELSVEVTKDGKITISNYKDGNGEITLVYYYYSIDGNTYNLAIKRDNQIESVNATAVYKDGRLTLTGALYGAGSVITFKK